MAINMPVLSLTYMELWLGKQVSQPARRVMEHLHNESSYEYFMRWAAIHHIQVDFHAENYSKYALFDPIVCVPIGMPFP